MLGRQVLDTFLESLDCVPSHAYVDIVELN